MCEILAVAWPEPRPFAELVAPTAELERLGLGSFGWGVAWLAGGEVQRVRGLGRFTEEAAADPELAVARSERFLVHLRRPSRLSTVALPDTQPFLLPAHHAWCHNGYLNRADELRDRWAGRLEGRADSEVGWLHFRDRLDAGDSPEQALRSVDETFGGHVNLGYLGLDGTLAVYSHNASNHFWRFRLGDGEAASTALHSDDESVFTWVFPEARDRERIPAGTGAVLGARERSAASAR